MLDRRKALSAVEADKAALMIQRTFLESQEYRNAHTIALYAAIHKEVGTAVVQYEALASARRVLYPAVRGEKLEFRLVLTPSKLHKGAFGIPEPDDTCEVVDPSNAALIVVPGVAFDMTGKRVGYGKGYYDKTLHHLEGRGVLVGFCYDFQLVEVITGEPHDVTMDFIITDKRVVRPRY